MDFTCPLCHLNCNISFRFKGGTEFITCPKCKRPVFAELLTRSSECALETLTFDAIELETLIHVGSLPGRVSHHLPSIFPFIELGSVASTEIIPSVQVPFYQVIPPDLYDFTRQLEQSVIDHSNISDDIPFDYSTEMLVAFYVIDEICSRVPLDKKFIQKTMALLDQVQTIESGLAKEALETKEFLQQTGRISTNSVQFYPEISRSIEAMNVGISPDFNQQQNISGFPDAQNDTFDNQKSSNKKTFNQKKKKKTGSNKMLKDEETKQLEVRISAQNGFPYRKLYPYGSFSSSYNLINNQFSKRSPDSLQSITPLISTQQQIQVAGITSAPQTPQNNTKQTNYAISPVQDNNNNTKQTQNPQLQIQDQQNSQSDLITPLIPSPTSTYIYSNSPSPGRINNLSNVILQQSSFHVKLCPDEFNSRSLFSIKTPPHLAPFHYSHSHNNTSNINVNSIQVNQQEINEKDKINDKIIDEDKFNQKISPDDDILKVEESIHLNPDPIRYQSKPPSFIFSKERAFPPEVAAVGCLLLILREEPMPKPFKQILVALKESGLGIVIPTAAVIAAEHYFASFVNVRTQIQTFYKELILDFSRASRQLKLNEREADASWMVAMGYLADRNFNKRQLESILAGSLQLGTSWAVKRYESLKYLQKDHQKLLNSIKQGKWIHDAQKQSQQQQQQQPITNQNEKSILKEAIDNSSQQSNNNNSISLESAMKVLEITGFPEEQTTSCFPFKTTVQHTKSKDTFSDIRENFSENSGFLSTSKIKTFKQKDIADAARTSEVTMRKLLAATEGDRDIIMFELDEWQEEEDYFISRTYREQEIQLVREILAQHENDQNDSENQLNVNVENDSNKDRSEKDFEETKKKSPERQSAKRKKKKK